MIRQIKPDLSKYVEDISQSDEIDSNLNGRIYGELSSPLIEITDMGVTMHMRIDLEGIIDDASRMRDWINSRRMI